MLDWGVKISVDFIGESPQIFVLTLLIYDEFLCFYDEFFTALAINILPTFGCIVSSLN